MCANLRKASVLIVAMLFIVAVDPQPVVANPTIISVTLDTDSSVSETIDSKEGGTITLTSVDGTFYSLTIPPGALYSPETITLAPVSDVANLPLSGGLTAAVDLLPNGLRLAKPATLTITPAAEVQVADSIGFGYQNNELYLYPVIAIDSASIVLKLIHFSGYGSGTGTAADIADQQQHLTSSAENNAYQATSEIVTDAARRSETDPSFTSQEIADLEGIFQDWYDDSIKSQLTAAQTDETILSAAIKEFLSWYAYLNLLGLESSCDSQYYEGLGLIGAGITNAIDKAYTKCTEDHDTSQIAEMLAWEADAQLLGLWGDGSLESSPTIDKVKGCATFQLEFTSQINWDSDDYTVSSGVTSEVPLTLSPDLLELQGEGTLSYPTFTYTNLSLPCQVLSTERPNGTLSVPHVMLDLNLKDGSTHDVTMILDEPFMTEYIHESCTDPNGNLFPLDTDNSYWSNGFVDLRYQAGEYDLGKIIIKNWTVTGGETYAVRELNQTSSSYGVTITEIGTLKLIHTPQQVVKTKFPWSSVLGAITAGVQQNKNK